MNVQQRTVYCRAEVSDDLQLSGTAIRYGDIARLPFGSESIDPGAFGNLEDADLILNRQHDRAKPLARTGGGGLSFINSPTELKLSADLPDTQTGREAITLVRSGVLRGFSVEFRALKEYVKDRVVHVADAVLVGVALVDKPAYPSAQVNRHQTILESFDPCDCGNFRWRMGLVKRGAI